MESTGGNCPLTHPGPPPPPPTLPHPSSKSFHHLPSSQTTRRPRSNTTPNHRWTPPISPSYIPPNPSNLKYSHQSTSFETTTNPDTNKTFTSSTLGTIDHIRKKLSRPSLKREATSPVYLDDHTISIPSIVNNSTRRVAPCMSSRLRGGDSDVASISSQDEFEPNQNHQNQKEFKEKAVKEKKRKGIGQRNKWTKEETEALVRGCNTFAIGQWKAIRDNDPLLANRSPGDLKDRFRTYFPDAYRKHYPNAKTHISTRVRSLDSQGKSLFSEGAGRKERKQFTFEEDEALKKGYAKFGTAWSSIQRDPILSSRKATDLRDRFRNAFPDLYSAAAGYKSRSRKASASDVFSYLPNEGSSTTGPHGTFEAMDVPGLSIYPNRSYSQMRPDTRYEFPSLDFLKAHGANAFSDFREMIYGAGQLYDSQYAIGDRQMIIGAIPNHLTNNTTPRPNLTPRPNDTTPRPKLTLDQACTSSVVGDSVPNSAEGDEVALGLSNSITGSVFRPLHRTQSSMDLSQFSNLHLVDAHNLVSPTSSQFSGNGYHPMDQFDFPAPPDMTSSSGSPYLREAPNYSSPDLSLLPDPPNQAGTTIEGCYYPPGHLSDPSSSDWLPDFDIASQTFPSAFGCGQGIMNLADAESSVSSFHSSRSSMSDPLQLDEHDRVLYTVPQVNQSTYYDQVGNSNNSNSNNSNNNNNNGISTAANGVHETLFPGSDSSPLIDMTNDRSGLSTHFRSRLAFEETEPDHLVTSEGSFN
ncbi:uncharacterized protein MELLADRAFT_91966 [Melampsora larici-populina 98AG31]|uniref:Myb-like domain-containing protein n=1 Tax=Melampsora larici-populina (strain 98AG31 / pathotype 3-4-7) TaxID=747676 RepID=F4S118_MELLP|nr:uncharacterized protein MELLADRAFT_91966 [Melampsora larici-populina 98AG31]EGG01717.1 hypothetical protein MELLADRAFT_91966 [Melampsora larici-populina 98AG31]